MATGAQRPTEVPASVEKRVDRQGLIIAVIPAVIAALASISGVVVGEINHARTVDRTNEITRQIADQTNKINVNIAASNNNAIMLNELIQHQLLPYRDAVVASLSTVNAEFNRVCRLSEAETSEALVRALEQLGMLIDRPPYRWDKGVSQKMKVYNDFVANAYAEISTANASQQEKQQHTQQAASLRESLLDSIDAYIAKVGP
jgi:hypothetical protein